MSFLNDLMGNPNKDAPLPAGVDPSIQEALTPAQLEHILNEVAPATLGKGMLKVGFKDEATKQFEPWNVTLQGALNILGDVHVWLAEIDIRLIETADHVLQLVGQIHQSFEQAEKALKNGTAYAAQEAANG